MDAEKIILSTVKGLMKFLDQTFGESVSRQFSESVEHWPSTWRGLKEWIIRHPFTTMKTTITSFAENLPRYESFEWELRQSLTLHEEFWNKVYSNFCLAKRMLTS